MSKHTTTRRAVLAGAASLTAVPMAAATARLPLSSEAPSAAPVSIWEVLNAYSEWLDNEHRVLQTELHPGLDGSHWRYTPVGTLARNYHFPTGVDWETVPKPSTRAMQVLSTVGVFSPPAAGRCADPVFAAIDKFKVHDQITNELASREDNSAGWEAEWTAALEKHEAATNEMLETLPKTRAGTLALLEFVSDRGLHQNETDMVTLLKTLATAIPTLA